MKSNRWCFTTWDFNRIYRVNTKLFEYFVICEEIAPTTQKVHYQGFCITRREYSLGAIKKIIDPKGHFEEAYASNKECDDYCRKDGVVIRSHGVWQEYKDLFSIVLE